MATQDDYIRTALRVPPDLHAKIHESAKENNRTFNAEIVARLEGSFGNDENSRMLLGNPAFSKFAARLHGLQGQRSTLALIADALRLVNPDAKQLLQLQAELEKIDANIATTLTGLQGLNLPSENSKN